MLTEHSVVEAARSAGLDASEGRVRFVPATDSTNADLLDAASREGGARPWTVLVAGHQRRGRGRMGRTWEAPPGMALLVSILVPSPDDPSLAPLASFAAAVALCEALGGACGVAARCKWPNDVLIGERKVAGILAEGRVEAGRTNALVVGCGVNVLQRAADLPAEARAGATSVLIERGTPDLPSLLEQYLRRLRALAPGPARPFDVDVLAPYRGLCSTIGRRVRATTSTGEDVEGEAIGIGPAGQLEVESHGGVRSVTFGDVIHLRSADRDPPASSA